MHPTHSMPIQSKTTDCYFPLPLFVRCLGVSSFIYQVKFINLSMHSSTHSHTYPSIHPSNILLIYLLIQVNDCFSFYFESSNLLWAEDSVWSRNRHLLPEKKCGLVLDNIFIKQLQKCNKDNFYFLKRNIVTWKCIIRNLS